MGRARVDVELGGHAGGEKTRRVVEVLVQEPVEGADVQVGGGEAREVGRRAGAA
jgi:hypothetical protein